MPLTLSKLDYHLGNPSMTLLHRAGLAGLWMTLNQLTIEQFKPIQGLKWELGDRSISLFWEGKDLDVLNWLLQEAFQLRG